VVRTGEGGWIWCKACSFSWRSVAAVAMSGRPHSMLNLMRVLAEWLGLFHLNMWVYGERQESPERVRAFLATYYLTTV
jgi:hypothetical protein